MRISEIITEGEDPCWKNYKQVGTKEKDGRKVPNCVPREGVEEGSMAAAANKPDGPKFGEDTLNEIDYASSLGELRLTDEQIIKDSTLDGTIGSKKVFLFDSGFSKIYFFTDSSKIEALLYLENGRLKAMKNFSENKGLIYNLFQYVINIKKQKIKLDSTDSLTLDGINWVTEQIKRPNGFKIVDDDGNTIDPDMLYDEWETARITGKNGPTAITIGESSQGKRVRENERRLMPMDLFGATLKEMNDPLLSRMIVPSLLDEGSMNAAAKRDSGSKFGGYYGATQKGAPKPGQGFGGAAESVGVELDEVAPPGMEDTVLKLKKQYPGEPQKAYATAWSMYNKQKGKK
jgi:hypothetical protein